jgi:P-type conjugative transfer protein TrbG
MKEIAMNRFVRLVVLMPICSVALSGCAGMSFLPTFMRPAPAEAHTVVAQAQAPVPAQLIQVAQITQPVPLSPGQLQPPPKPIVQAKLHPLSRVDTANRAALQEPTSDGYINAIQVYPYSDGVLYRLYAAPQEVSDIALQPGESVIAVSAGDTTRWVVGDTSSGSGSGKQVHILVKPFAAGLRTNLVVTTDRRSYHLQLESTDRTYMAAVSWTYPQDGLVSPRADGTLPAQVTSMQAGISPDDLHFRYAISGDNPSWKPLRAFDDGTHVYIEFPAAMAQGDAPPLFVKGADGNSNLVNYRVRGSYYIVDQLFDGAELRLGQDHQQVVRLKRTEETRTAGTSTHFLGIW